MKNFAFQLIQHVNGSDPLNDAGLAALKAKCVRSLKNTAAEGVPLEPEATAPHKALIKFSQIIDNAVLQAGTKNKNRSGRRLARQSRHVEPIAVGQKQTPSAQHVTYL